MDPEAARHILVDSLAHNLKRGNYVEYELQSLTFFPTLEEVSYIFSIAEFEKYLAFKLLMKSSDSIEVYKGMNPALAEYIKQNENIFNYTKEKI